MLKWPQRSMLPFRSVGFGGVKSHPMWAVGHLARREGRRGESQGQHAEDLTGQADNSLYRPQGVAVVSEAGILGD